MHLYEFFPHVKVRTDSPKRLGTNKIVRPKSHKGSKFSKLSLEPLYTWGTVVVHLYCDFSLRRQMAPQQSAKFRTTFLIIFLPVWGRIASPIMHRFGRRFRRLLWD